jgi:hypothetical protein
MRKIILAIGLGLATTGHAQDSGNRLNLICGGQGAANKPTTSNAYAWDNEGGSANATINGTRSVSFGDEVALWIEGGEGRLRMPRIMLPALRGGDNGWFKLKSIVVNEREITASVAVNPLNNPKMRLDRMTGSISLSGKAGDYTGGCEKFDPEATEKKF